MKTPMQELIEKLDKAIDSGINTPSTWSYIDAIQSLRDIAERMLEKEREVIENAWANGRFDWGVKNNSSEDYYNETFNTK